MAKKRIEMKLKALALLDAAESILLESVTRAAGFDDAADFKKAVIADLEAYQPFDRATREFHRQHAGPASSLAPAPKAKDEWKGQPRASGRVQAARFDPSSNQKDRRRGIRKPGGKRSGQGHGKNGKA